MAVRVTIKHALTQGDRMHYTGTQSWGPCNVTVIKTWGGHADPLYSVRPDGMGEASAYVVSESELRPIAGVTLGKATDKGARMPVHPWTLAARLRETNPRVELLSAHREGLRRNDHETLRSAFAIMAGSRR